MFVLATYSVCVLHTLANALLIKLVIILPLLIILFNDCFRQVRPNIESRRSSLCRIIIYAHVYVGESVNCEHRKNSQFTVIDISH